MTYRAFNLHVILIVLVLGGAFLCFNYWVNIYGVFGDVSGKSYSPLGGGTTEYVFKYLFSYNYIPRNFDGLMIGSSITDNWDTSRLNNVKVYNASLNGGRIADAKQIVDVVLKYRPNMLIIFVIHPIMTQPSSFGVLEKGIWAALGSLELFRAYYLKLQFELGFAPQEFNSFGQYDFPEIRKKWNETNVDISEGTFDEYRLLVEHARYSGARVVGLISPIAGPLFKKNREAYRRYYARMRRLFKPWEPIIDLNGPEYDFTDGTHMSRIGARQAIDAVDLQLDAWMSEGLPMSCHS